MGADKALLEQDGVALAERVARALAAGRCRAFGPHYVHQVTNTGAVPAVSVHVYTPGLTMMNRYRVEPGELRHAAAERAGVDW